MKVYIPGMPVQYIDEPAPATEPKQGELPLPEVAQAMALAQARQTQVLDYTRKKAPESPLTQNLRTDGPTLEQWVGAGYQIENYPPVGYAELPSPLLEAIQKAKAAATSSGPHSINAKPEVET
jgi:hypothetical protein